MFKWSRSELRQFWVTLFTWIIRPEAAWGMITGFLMWIVVWVQARLLEDTIIYSLGVAAFTALLVNQTRQIRYAKLLPSTTDTLPIGVVNLPAVQSGKLGEKYFADVKINIADLLKEGLILKGKTFERCQIVGPALLRPIKGIITECHFKASFPTEGPRDYMWIVPEGRNLVGVIGVEDCLFKQCWFIDIAMVGREQEVASWMSESKPVLDNEGHGAIKT